MRRFDHLVSLGLLSIYSFASSAVLAIEPTALVRAAGDVAVTADDVRAEVQQRVPPAERATVQVKPELVQTMANNLLVRRLLANQALRDGLDKQTITAAALKIAADRILSDAWLAAFDAKNEPNAAALEANARQQYLVGGEKFSAPAETRASHILIENKGPESLQLAKDLFAKLQAGANFAELARSHSADAGSAVKGGDLGFFGAGKMVPEFEQAVAALTKPGELAGPLLTQFGYHIIRLEDRRPAGKRPFDEVREQLIAEARASVLTRLRQEHVQALSQGFVFDKAAIEALGKSAAPGQ